MPVKKLDQHGLEVYSTLVKSYINATADKTAEQKYRDTMKQWFETKGSATAPITHDTSSIYYDPNDDPDALTLTDLHDLWYEETRENWDGNVRFFNPFPQSPGKDMDQSEGDKGGDNANLTCTPSTCNVNDSFTDDYAGNPLFAPTDVNWAMDKYGEPIIVSINGIMCKRTFTRTDPTVYVGVTQQTGYHWWTTAEDSESMYYYEGYCSRFKAMYAHIEPLPEAVTHPTDPSTGDVVFRPDRVVAQRIKDDQDNTVCEVRSWVIHSKYMTDLYDAIDPDTGSVVDTVVSNTHYTGAMTSYSGGATFTYVFSHNSSHYYARNNCKVDGQTALNTYSGATITDNAFLILMARIKYGSLTMDGIIQGCVSYSFQYPASVTTVDANAGKFVVVTNSQANNVLIGSTVLVGYYNNGIDRSNANTYSVPTAGGNIANQRGYRVVDKVPYDSSNMCIMFDETECSVPVYSTASGANVNGTTYISSFIWRTGSLDGTQGNDGAISKAGLTNGKEPAKLQGIEYMMGAYEVFADVILKLYEEPASSGSYWYQPYIVRSVGKQATSITNDYVATGLIIAQGASAGWNYIKYMEYKNGLYFATLVGGSSTTYTRDGMYREPNIQSTRQWQSYGNLWNGVGSGGLSALAGYNGLGLLNWLIATRLSCNGNRGVFIRPMDE